MKKVKFEQNIIKNQIKLHILQKKTIDPVKTNV